MNWFHDLIIIECLNVSMEFASYTYLKTKFAGDEFLCIISSNLIIQGILGEAST